jgi:hypothetical protein
VRNDDDDDERKKALLSADPRHGDDWDAAMKAWRDAHPGEDLISSSN